MKKILFSLLLVSLGLSAFAQDQYDETLAQRLGADDYGMKKYIMLS